MSKPLIITAHGMGDCMLAFQCSQSVKDSGGHPHVLVLSRDEVYKPLASLFSDIFSMEQGDERIGNENLVLKNDVIFKLISQGYEEVYYVIPDLLFNNQFAFNYQKYNTCPSTLRSVRLLTKNRTVSKKIYLGLMTSTPGYFYEQPMKLAQELANRLTDYEIIFPIVTNWASKSLNHIDIPSFLPSNLKIIQNQTLENSLSDLRECCYFVGTDNGPSHIAYHMGIPRLVLDPQYQRLPWIARWREDFLESITIRSEVDEIVNIVETNLRIPQTTLIPRKIAALGLGAKWHETLLLKTE